MSDLYLRRNIVLGFHGGEKSVLMEILNQKRPDLLPSLNDYDWLGHGIYFWLNDPKRALEWAEERKKRGKCEEPCVLGAIIDLGHCLDLSNRYCIEALKEAYNDLCQLGTVLSPNARPDDGGFNLLRPLDCMVINYACELLDDAAKEEDERIDSVIGYFVEGGLAYEGAGFHNKSHAQICVRNKKKILGYFLPKDSL